ncbi:uncharacterized protein LOC135691014 [Rhopilema esculentum]|uniref:uncharacterized protein LOC135691014 n=1 Tax=Rhopilema esculentum TaxID=499914 RepID=UPI0031D8FB0F
MMAGFLLAFAALIFASSAAANTVCVHKYQMIGCFQEDSPGKLLINEEHVIDWKNIGTFLSGISCKCAEAAKAQGFAGYAIHYGGQCYGRTKDQVTALMKKEHMNQICYGEQIYVDCLKDEHSHCMGKENAEAVYQFIDSAEENVDGGFGDWLPWTKCDKECGEGFMYRERNCDNPPPKGEGKDCSHLGPYTERKPCVIKECPVDGVWSEYGSYGLCSKSCGGGVQYRHRNCSNPAPAHGGKCCTGHTSEAKACNIQLCPVNGGWSPYSQYSLCSKHCGGGNQTRHRLCNNPLPQNGGESCHGPSSESKSCNTDVCPAIHLCNLAYTNYETHGGGNMVYLDRHRVQCAGSGSILSMFYLEKNGEKIRFRYQCCKIEGQGVCSSSQKTSLFSEDGTGNTRYLDRHAMDCSTKGFISEFRLERNAAGNKVRYNYQCCQLSANWTGLAQCYTRHTGFTFDGNGRVYYLDRQMVSCDAGYALSYIQLQRNNIGGDQYRYIYRCCKVNF